MTDEELQDLLDEQEESNGNLVEAMLVALAAWLIAVGNVSREELRAYVYQTFPGVIAAYQQAAIQKAYEFYLKLRVMYGFGNRPAPRFTDEDVNDVRDYATRTGVVVSAILRNSYDSPVASQDVLDAVHKIASNAVLDADKGIQLLMAQRDEIKTKTIWHTESGACPWCADREGLEVTRIESHDGCRCSLRTVFIN